MIALICTPVHLGPLVAPPKLYHKNIKSPRFGDFIWGLIPESTVNTVKGLSPVEVYQKIKSLSRSIIHSFFDALNHFSSASFKLFPSIKHVICFSLPFGVNSASKCRAFCPRSCGYYYMYYIICLMFMQKRDYFGFGRAGDKFVNNFI